MLEFDAMEEPPSVLDVEVFDFDGPFDQATSLGHAEINFLKHTSTELADMWIFLEGKLAQSSQSKLHLRIFLDNNQGVETIKEYLTKMGKEVGKKVNIVPFFCSPSTHLSRKVISKPVLIISFIYIDFYIELFCLFCSFFSYMNFNSCWMFYSCIYGHLTGIQLSRNCLHCHQKNF